MDGLDTLCNWIYSEGDLLMFASRSIILLFVLETFAYIISLIVSAAKTASC